jgi:hypothetical protein
VSVLLHFVVDVRSLDAPLNFKVLYIHRIKDTGCKTDVSLELTFLNQVLSDRKALKQSVHGNVGPSIRTCAWTWQHF